MRTLVVLTIVTDRQRIEWEDESNRVTDLMKVHTRPYVVILAGGEPGERPPDVGTGTFLDPDGVKLLTCDTWPGLNRRRPM
jgi:hypothetical protein